MKKVTKSQKLRLALRSLLKAIAFDKYKANISHLDYEALQDCLAQTKTTAKGQPQFARLSNEGFETQFGLAFKRELKYTPISIIDALQAVELIKIQNTKEGLEKTFALIAKSGLKIISKKTNELVKFVKTVIDNGKLCLNFLVGDKKSVAYNYAFDRYFTIQ